MPTVWLVRTNRLTLHQEAPGQRGRSEPERFELIAVRNQTGPPSVID
jgi:hypothetical protein